jgi:RNA polymerase sigma factor (sigma-70 family)
MDAAAMAETVERARRGDHEGVAELYRAFGPRILALCRHILRSPQAAEDAHGDVFLRLPHAIDRYDPTLPFDRWLMSVASHHCLDMLRRRRLESRLFQSEPPDATGPALAAETSPSPLAAVLTDEGRRRVREALDQLPERSRLVLVLRYYGELSYEDIAAELAVTRSHVAILIFRAKQALRRLLADFDERA